MRHLLYFFFEKSYMIFGSVIKPDFPFDNFRWINNSWMIPIYGSADLFQGCAAIIPAKIYVYISWIRIDLFSRLWLKCRGIDLEILTYNLLNIVDRDLILFRYMAPNNLFGKRQIYLGLQKFWFSPETFDRAFNLADITSEIFRKEVYYIIREA